MSRNFYAHLANYCEILTSPDPNRRGAQLSVRFSCSVSEVFKFISMRGVVVRDVEGVGVDDMSLYNYISTYHLEVTDVSLPSHQNVIACIIIMCVQQCLTIVYTAKTGA